MVYGKECGMTMSTEHNYYIYCCAWCVVQDEEKYCMDMYTEAVNGGIIFC